MFVTNRRICKRLVYVLNIANSFDYWDYHHILMVQSYLNLLENQLEKCFGILPLENKIPDFINQPTKVLDKFERFYLNIFQKGLIFYKTMIFAF